MLYIVHILPVSRCIYPISIHYGSVTARFRIGELLLGHVSPTANDAPNTSTLKVSDRGIDAKPRKTTERKSIGRMYSKASHWWSKIN